MQRPDGKSRGRSRWSASGSARRRARAPSACCHVLPDGTRTEGVLLRRCKRFDKLSANGLGVSAWSIPTLPVWLDACRPLGPPSPDATQTRPHAFALHRSGVRTQPQPPTAQTEPQPPTARTEPVEVRAPVNRWPPGQSRPHVDHVSASRNLAPCKLIRVGARPRHPGRRQFNGNQEG